MAEDKGGGPATIPLPCACANIRRAARAVTQLYDEALKPSGLRSTQFALLQVLVRAGKATQGRMGEILGIDSTTLSRTLATLESAGWIRSTPGSDRRERYVELTSAGRRLHDRAVPAWEAVQRRYRERLGADKWAEMLTLLTSAAHAARSES